MNPQVKEMLSNGLRLYYKILKLHRKVLPKRMRALGDYYVRQEFKHHHENPQLVFYHQFYSKWDLYYDELSRNSLANVARNMSAKQESLLTADQRQALQNLKSGIQRNTAEF